MGFARVGRYSAQPALGKGQNIQHPTPNIEHPMKSDCTRDLVRQWSLQLDVGCWVLVLDVRHFLNSVPFALANCHRHIR
jgi:hypothetical protein